MEKKAEKKDTTTLESSGALPAEQKHSDSPVNFKVNGVTANALKNYIR
ncbi:MAG: hypothetical protein IPP72_15240 [Chitinophagaceae bacterium]|nr:hypothetical protein [Chitinophagaceae bacterium]